MLNNAPELRPNTFEIMAYIKSNIFCTNEFESFVKKYHKDCLTMKIDRIAARQENGRHILAKKTRKNFFV